MNSASADDWPCLRAGAQGAGSLLDLSIVPNARQTAVDGLYDGALRVRLAAPPVDGKANQRLVEWLAGELGLPRRAVSLHRGIASRRKQLAIAAPPATVAAWLDRVLTPRAD